MSSCTKVSKCLLLIYLVADQQVCGLAPMHGPHCKQKRQSFVKMTKIRYYSVFKFITHLTDIY